MYAMIQDADIKTKNLAKEMTNMELYQMKGSTNKIPIHLIKQILKRKKKPTAVILRYLNDSNTFMKSIIRCIINILTVILIKVLRIKLIWICHNVDKESRVHYPYLIKLRRNMMVKSSDKILVTDKLLIKHAARCLGVDKSKIDYLTFGEPDNKKDIIADNKIHQKIIDFVGDRKERQTLIGFSIGNPNRKVLQPFYTNELINKAAEKGVNLKIILGGPLGEFIKKCDINTYENLVANPNVLFLDGKVEIDEEYVSQFIDFYWRVYEDYSVPYTVYNAVYLKKPILSMDKGFLKEMVEEYGLGSILKNDMSNLIEALDDLKKDKSKNFNEFVSTHNWTIGADKLYRNISN